MASPPSFYCDKCGYGTALVDRKCSERNPPEDHHIVQAVIPVAPGNTRLRWPFVLHLQLINCTFGLGVMEEFDMMRKQVKVLEQELSDSLSVVPDRFMENLKHSTVQILDENSAPVGIGFFISTQIVVTAHHNIRGSSHIRALISTANGQTSAHTLAFAPSMEANAEKCKELDLAILKTETVHPHHLSIFSLDAKNMRVKDFALASYSIEYSQVLGKEFLADKFAVMPVTIYKATNNHVVYSANAFSGDSGGAVVCSGKGEVFALHLETVNQANEGLERDQYTLQDVAESVKSCIRGFSQGFLGLRLDSAEIRTLLFN